MKLKILVKACAGLVLASAFSSSAYAALCSNSDTMTTSDMKYNDSFANKCAYSSENNDSEARINTLGSALGWGSGWEFLVKDEINGDTTTNGETATYNGLIFTLQSGNIKQKSGTYLLSITDKDLSTPPNLPTTLDFVGVLKASDGYGAFLFEHLTVGGNVDSKGVATDGGVWSITYENNGHQIPKLSHIDIYVRQNTAQVPEPAAASLLGIGLLSFVAARRRRSGKA